MGTVTANPRAPELSVTWLDVPEPFVLVEVRTVGLPGAGGAVLLVRLLETARRRAVGMGFVPLRVATLRRYDSTAPGVDFPCVLRCSMAELFTPMFPDGNLAH